MLPPPELFGRKRRVDLRAVFNALCYVVCADYQYRLLPKEFPKRQTVYYFRKWNETKWFVAVFAKGY